MDQGRFMTPTQLRLYRESIIREFKLKQEEKHRNRGMNLIVRRLRSIVPVNILVGLIACIILVVYWDFPTLLKVFLTSVIWITITSTIVGAIIGKK